MNELVVINEKTDIAKLFKPESIDDILAKIRKEVEGFVPDTSTDKGRKEIGSLAAKVARSKTLIDGAGKKYVAELKSLPKKIDAERKRLRDECDKIKEEVRRPLTEWENVRKEVDARIGDFNTAIRETSELNSFGIQEKISWLNSFDHENVVEDKRDEFKAALDNAKLHLENAYLKAKKSEEEAAELERLRAEEADRKRKAEEEERIKAAEERARREAEEEAKKRELEAQLAKERAERAEKEAKERAERAERETKEMAEKAEREAREREERAAAMAKEQAEREACEREEKERAERKRREADEKNRASKINEAESSLRMNGYSAEEAERFVSLVIEGKIANIKMVF